MESIRKPFQGVWNIIRFNWQYYALAFVAVSVLLIFRAQFNHTIAWTMGTITLLIVAAISISLIVSCYIYDFSELYTLSWLDKYKIPGDNKILNIHAGLDETSALLRNKFPSAELHVFDFYDPKKHTEISIRRARRAYPPFPGTQAVHTDHLPLENKSTDIAFLILSAHEIRNHAERIAFFKEIHRVLGDTGKVIVAEHLRDTYNLLAYNIGFMHFHSRNTWINTFQNAGLRVSDEIKITPFITTFVLEKNGTPT